jgi:hypothetical protein
MQACHALLSLQRALADWCSQQPQDVLRGIVPGSQPGAGASQDEMGLLGELQQLVGLVPRRCRAVAAEFVGTLLEGGGRALSTSSLLLLVYSSSNN